jgi:uncharacterized protein YhbP (UPF0306 family)
MQTSIRQEILPQEITDFIKMNKVATICCIDEGGNPYCFNCFYAFQEKAHLLFFKSSAGSHHSKLLSQNFKVAGTILPDKVELLSLQGIQFSGRILQDQVPGQIRPEVFYHKVFPLALARPGQVWQIQLEMIKMTDNTWVSGKKIAWEKSN